MSGWIKLDKDLGESIRFRRVVRKLRDGSNALRSVTDALAVTIVLGALQRFWIYADTHIGDDNVLDITPDEINEIVGVDGFAQALPADWLKVLDPDQVQLPDFVEHNGSSEKQRRGNARRQAEYRHRHKSRNVTRYVTASNGRNDARPDQTRPEETRPEETRPDKDKDTFVGGAADPGLTSDPPTELGAMPALRSARQNRGWPQGLHEQIIATYHEVLPDLPAVRDWPERRRRKLDARISERVKAGKPADSPDYWRALFSNVHASDFLCGRKGEWRCPGLEWILEPRNFTKVIEGAYKNHSGMNGHAR